MMPLPWSNSSLEASINCPKSYQERWVLKRYKEAKGTQQLWGDNVHKVFELRQSIGQPLPIDLVSHEPYMRALEDKPGILFTELKVNMDRATRPINDAFSKDIWYRGIVDFLKVDQETRSACLVDYKSGKPHQKWWQLATYALWTFAMFPQVDLINAQFYFTQKGTPDKKVWERAEIPMLWGLFIADLKQYAEYFKAENWPARPSGLCKKHCPVITCQHNGGFVK